MTKFNLLSTRLAKNSQNSLLGLMLYLSKQLRGLVFVGAFSLKTMAMASEYYVAIDGADANPGTLAQPWRTIQKAANTLSPGDTVYVRAGVYSKVTVNVSGSASAGPVTFRNYPGEAPVIDATGVTPSAGDTALFLIVDRSHVVVAGFELRNYKTTSTTLVPAGVLIAGACQNVHIRGCNIHDIWNTGGNTSTAGNAFGIAVYGSSLTPSTGIVIDGNDVYHLKTGSSESVVINGNVTDFQVTNNTVHDNNNIGIDFIGFEGTVNDPAKDQAREGICRGNRVWNITSQGNQAYADGDYSAGGIYCDGAARVLIERNIVHDCDIGVELASERSGKVTNAITLRDNLVYSNRQTGLFLGGYASSGTGGTDGCVITGNTFFRNDTLGFSNGEVQLRFRTANCVFRNNIFYAGTGNWMITVPVSATQNVNNRFDYNLYFAGAGVSSALWSWNNTTRTGFGAWKSASGGDGASLFADPRFVAAGGIYDLHLQIDSPAYDAGDPAFTPGADETDIDGAVRKTGARVDIGADELAAFESWRRDKFGVDAGNAAVSGATANPSGDGVANLLKYALGLDPLARVPAGVLTAPAVVATDDKRYLAISFTRSLSATDVTCMVQAAETPGEWADGSSYGAKAGGAVSAVTTEVARTGGGATETITVRDNTDLDSNPRRFLRLKVSLP